MSTVTFRDAVEGLFRGPKKPDLDQAVLVQLRKAGSDLSRLHAIDFFLYLPTQETAQRVALRLQGEGFETRVERAAQGDNWLCQAKWTMIPDLAVLQKIRIDFSAIAQSLGGSTMDGEPKFRSEGALFPAHLHAAGFPEVRGQDAPSTSSGQALVTAGKMPALPKSHHPA